MSVLQVVRCPELSGPIRAGRARPGLPGGWVGLSRWLLLLGGVLAATACGTTSGMDRYARQIAQGEALAVPVVHQTSRADCGMAALLSVMEYYRGPHYSQQALLERYPPASPQGYSLGELRHIAQRHEFVGFVVPADKAFLRSQLSRQRPVVVPLQVQGATPPVPGLAALSARLIEPLLNRAVETGYDHYVVVVGLDDERRQVLALDPARGPVEIPYGDFAAGWEKMNHAALVVGLAAGAD